MPGLTVALIAEICTGEIEGSKDRFIAGANTLEDATEDQLSFAAYAKAFARASASHAGCLIVPHEYPAEDGRRSLIRVKDARTAFARALAEIYPETRRDLPHTRPRSSHCQRR